MRQRRFVFGLLSVLGVLGGAVVAAPTSSSALQPNGSWDPGLAEEKAHPALAGSLLDDVEAGQVVFPASGDPGGGASIEVVVEADEPGEAQAAVAAVGGAVSTDLDTVVQAVVPVSSLTGLAEADGVRLVREPIPARSAEASSEQIEVLADATSQGVTATGAGAWHAAGWTGVGVSVATIEIGFDGYDDLLGTELPDSVETDFTRCEDPFDNASGTAEAEVIHDLAPHAAQRLICVDSDVEFQGALLSLLNDPVDIVNVGVTFILSGRGDGFPRFFVPSEAPPALERLHRAGTVVVAAAGDYGGKHFHAPANGDGILGQFGYGEGASDYVDLTDDDRLTFTVPGNGVAFVGMQWDSWRGEQTPDFDMYVGNNTCGEVGASEGTQGYGQPPVEAVVFQNCSASPQTFEVLVNRFRFAGTPRIDLWFDGAISSIETPTASSITEPASFPSVVAVGAHCASSGALQPYSSQGPTIDGRPKPDLAATDAVSTTTYGTASGCNTGFRGSWAAAAHAAGVAALIRGANDDADPSELLQMLRRRAVDAGSPGPDRSYGSGRLHAGAPGSAASPPPQPFTPVAPIRLYDTRAGLVGTAESPARGTPIGANGFLAVTVRGASSGAGVPTNASAVVLNVTATEPTGDTFLTVQPGTNQPTTSNVNVRPGQTFAQNVTATVARDGKVRIYNLRGTTHVVVDLLGWYGPTGVGGVAARGLFTSLIAPRRAFDSRAETTGYGESPARSGPLSGGNAVDVIVAGRSGVPAGATAVALNVTVTGPTAGAHLTVYPSDAALPGSSSINFVPGQTVPNLVITKVSPNGRVRLRLNTGAAHVIVDTLGWYQTDVGDGYVALDPPRRLVDTREGPFSYSQPVGAGQVITKPIGGYGGVPFDAAAVVLSQVAVGPTGAGFVTTFAAGAARPLASSLNFVPGDVVPNATISTIDWFLGARGFINFFNSSGQTHLVADVSGYFQDPIDVAIPRATALTPFEPWGPLEEWVPPADMTAGTMNVAAAVDQGQFDPTRYDATSTAVDATLAGGQASLSFYGSSPQYGSQSRRISLTAGDPAGSPETGEQAMGGFGIDDLNCEDTTILFDEIEVVGTVLHRLVARYEGMCAQHPYPPARFRGYLRYDIDDDTLPPGPSPARLGWSPPDGILPSSGPYLYYEGVGNNPIGKGRTELYTIPGPLEVSRYLSDGYYPSAFSASGQRSQDNFIGFSVSLPLGYDEPAVGRYRNVEEPRNRAFPGVYAGETNSNGCQEGFGTYVVDRVEADAEGLLLVEVRMKFECFLGYYPPIYAAFRWVRPLPD